MNLVAVIMAGGKGERFWPKSRSNYPKQFLKLFGQRTMLQLTVDRILPLMPINNVFIVTNEQYKNLVKEQLPELPEGNIIIEPVGRNTAPCIGLAAIHIEKIIKDSVMFVFPSDHMIIDTFDFQQKLKKAVELAYKENALITLGIKPDKPETGYGYIKVLDEQVMGANKVEKFVEKPDLQTAKKYLESGKYLWNSGMFIWKTNVILQEIKKHLPEVYQGLYKISKSFNKDNYDKILKIEFPKLQSISIDYGIMEKAEKIFVFASSFGWDDVGSWVALERINQLDDCGNYIKGDIISIDSKRCIIEADDKLIAAIGLEDLIIVDTKDATLICKKEQAQRIKDALQIIKEKNKEIV